MVEVLEPPKKQTADCKYCGAVLQYMMTDARRQIVGGGPNIRIHAYFIDCPCCSHSVRVSD